MISLGGAGKLVWPAAPDHVVDHSVAPVVPNNPVGDLIMDKGAYDYCTWESSGTYLYASTANTLYHKTGIIIRYPRIAGAFAKCMLFEFYVPSANRYAQVQGAMGLGNGPEIGMANGGTPSTTYQLIRATGSGYEEYQPILTPLAHDTWHTVRHVVLASGDKATWVNGELVIAMAANTLHSDNFSIYQLKVPGTADKLTHAMRIRNIRIYGARTDAPNVA